MADKRDPTALFGTERTIRSYESRINGKTYHFRELASSEGDVYMRVLRNAAKGFTPADQRALCAVTLCWEDGERLGSLKDIEKILADEPTALVGELFLEALSVNGATKTEVEAEKKS